MHFFVHVFARPARTAACPELILGEDVYPCDSYVLIDWHVKHVPGVGVARKFVRMTEKVDIFACHARTAACPALILDEDLRVHATDVLTELGPGSSPGRGVARAFIEKWSGGGSNAPACPDQTGRCPEVSRETGIPVH